VGLAGCQIRKAHQSWHVKSGRGGTRWYLPKSCVTEYRLPTLGHRRLRREGKDWQLEWDRTRQNRAGEHLLSNSVLAFGRARTFPPGLPARHKLICCYCSTITRSISSVESICKFPEPLSLYAHPQRYMSIHPERFGGACRCSAKKKSCQAKAAASPAS
jgi:hypothetical protein